MARDVSESSGEWMNSEDFLMFLKKISPFIGNILPIKYFALAKKAKRSEARNLQTIQIQRKSFSFRYIPGRGRGGRILQIYNKPLTPAEIEEIEAQDNPSSLMSAQGLSQEGLEHTKEDKGGKTDTDGRDGSGKNEEVFGVCRSSKGYDNKRDVYHERNRILRRTRCKKGTTLPSPRGYVAGGLLEGSGRFINAEEGLEAQSLNAHIPQSTPNTTKENRDEIPNKIRTAESLGEVSKVSQANDDQADRGHRGDYERRVSGGEVEYERLYRASPQRNDDSSKRAGGVYSSNHKGIQALESQSSTPPPSLPLIATCSDKKRKEAFEKYRILKEWERAKGKLKESLFIEHINAKKVCSTTLTPNKLYEWQRRYKRGGLDALVDERKSHKRLNLEKLGLKEHAIELIHAQKGSINITNIYRLLNYEAIKRGAFTLLDFQGKKDEIISYEVVNRFVRGYLKENRLLKEIILYGEDGAISRNLPALGRSNWAVSSINQIVEIDASPLDLICNASDICEEIGFLAVNNVFKDKEFLSYVKEWQRRYTVIALIDTYSGVASFHISDTENSIGIARALAKYILRYGKPKVIKGDNGKAFKSEHIAQVMNSLEIEYRAVRAYSGWLKPYVERNFRALQHSFSANLAGFIGHDIIQRQAIEFFYSKKERRLKRGVKTNLKRIKSVSEVQELMDLYAEKFLNTRYLERLGMSVCEAYNQKAHEAVLVDALSLSARLSKRELKRVGKKGISVNGVWYQSPKLYLHDNVYANLNIDNQNECFLWDKAGEFIDVATIIDMEAGLSSEVAKASAKLFNRRLKEQKAHIQSARGEHEDRFVQFVREIEAKGAIEPQAKAQNSESLAIKTALKSAQGVMRNEAVSEEVLERAKNHKKGEKKHKGWEYFSQKIG